jgi:hypothetical protein
VGKAEQEFEKRFFDVYQKARKGIGGGDPSLDAAYDPIFEALLNEFARMAVGLGTKFNFVPKTAPQKSDKVKPVKAGNAGGKPKAEPLTNTDARFGVYVTALQPKLNFDAPKSEWRKREPGEVARAIGLKLSYEASRIFGKALKYVLKTETAKAYLVPPIK